ncbi:hypothetical protein Pmani_007570 [Petrolisthes manimaculis]|uniref:Uncharacterized protein n=1 Tax=Petrolisthes manimaculis TaxID=1843537 RepID=A0AAE1Q7G1_9EUCA|nr:hypothetical protein Pmani_007570 [Petrolisthes manimaculis]
MASSTTTPGVTLPYPRGAFFILVGYLLERFVYYGLFGGAVFYMQRMLGFTSSSAKTVKAVMEGLIYLAPIAGAILADTYFGKARTVFVMCCGYTVGAGIYSLSSVTPIMASVTSSQATGIMGLLVLGVCAGLMKAVYSSLGADQFKVPEQREQQKRFFYAFYWMINAGAFLGQFMTAQLRDSVQCFGDDCYFLPYIILVGLMALSTLIFALGRSRYSEAPPDPTLLNAIKCIFHATRKSWESNKKPVTHWIDRAHDKFDTQLLRDVKATLRVLMLFSTFPLFWALFYQTSTGMIFQAKRLDGLVGSYRIPPEMSSTVNPLLILTLIPLFNLVIYPILDRLDILTKTTSRMILGMAFAVSSFIVYALVNMNVEQVIIPPQQARLHLYNTLPCDVTVSIPTRMEGKLDGVDGEHTGGSGGMSGIIVPTLERSELPDFDVFDSGEVTVRIETKCPAPDMSRVKVATLGGHESTLVVTATGTYVLSPTLEYIKDMDAEAKLRFIAPAGNAANLTLKYETLQEHFELQEHGQLGAKVSEFRRISPKDYKVLYDGDELGEAPVRQDGVYDVVLTDTLEVHVFPMTAPAGVHMFWLLPQYLLITIGEVLFSVSGMDFAYSEAPTAMKSTLQAANLFTITVGLWLFAGLTSVTSATGVFDNRASHEAILYAVLMALNTVVFVLLLRRFYRERESEVEEQLEEQDATTPRSQQQQQHDNPAYVEDHF